MLQPCGDCLLLALSSFVVDAMANPSSFTTSIAHTSDSQPPWQGTAIIFNLTTTMGVRGMHLIHPDRDDDDDDADNDDQTA